MTTLDFRKCVCTICNVDLHDWDAHTHINTPAHLKCAQFAFENRKLSVHAVNEYASFIYQTVITKKEQQERKVNEAAELIKQEIKILKLENEHLKKQI